MVTECHNTFAILRLNSEHTIKPRDSTGFIRYTTRRFGVPTCKLVTQHRDGRRVGVPPVEHLDDVRSSQATENKAKYQ